MSSWLKFVFAMFWRHDEEEVIREKQGYIVNAVLGNCRIVQGVRKKVYELASMNCGRYTNSEDREESIGYKDEDLVINIAFPSEEQATCFVNVLQQFGGEDSPICKSMELFHDNRKYRISDKIWLSHYKPGKGGPDESPPRSFSTTSLVSLGDPVAFHQSVEDPSVVKQSCHMYGRRKPKRDDLPNHVTNANNRICLSPTLHVLYDGYENGMSPVFRMKPVEVHSQPVQVVVSGVMEVRYKVDVLLEFMSIEATSMYNGRLKENHVRRSQTEFLTHVHVLDPEEFSRFMMWKYDDTTKKWP